MEDKKEYRLSARWLGTMEWSAIHETGFRRRQA
jgi:hypothetical protein